MKFSIIIPAYNSAAYIRKALDSIVEQTYTDYELIVVCDSCEDNTAEIAREYTDEVVEVSFHNEGCTRNTGLDMARGDYILFMDDDDWWIHDRVLERINTCLFDYDIVCFGFHWQHKGYAPPGDYYAVWNKCWRRAFIDDTRFPENMKDRSDVGFHDTMWAKTPKVALLDECLYYYNYLREGSVSWARGC